MLLNSAAEVQAVLRGITFGSFGLGVFLSLTPDLLIRAHLFVPDRDNPEIVTPLHTVGLALQLPVAEDYVLEMARSQCHIIVGHELDECMMYKGVRRWDPHIRLG